VKEVLVEVKPASEKLAPKAILFILIASSLQGVIEKKEKEKGKYLFFLRILTLYSSLLILRSDSTRREVMRE